ncbi:MAG: DUF922 domain-containing protein [Sphingobacteriales bacterium JAD_PAG50586_3]|nr:MAG: DUF922 domain-containing protein [Sphingobacteriales bacterium JAD_PAG50586_3]
MLLPLLLLSFSYPYPTPAKQTKIFWDENNSLDWQLFQVRDLVAGNHAAQSNIGISTSCEYSQKGGKITVRATFNQANSWVRHDCITDHILNHEQRHFDISELFARKMRKQLTEANITPQNFKVKYNAIYNTIVAEHNAYQDLYDDQSEHSIDEEGQNRWNLLIDTQLDELSYYANPEVIIPLGN